MGNVMAALPALMVARGIDPFHVCHVGAHEGQELPFYRHAGFRRITAVEPLPDLADRLRRDHPDVAVVEAACSSVRGWGTLSVMARTNMSTLELPRRDDRVKTTVTVELRRLDEIAPDANVVVVDAQGHELEVLAAAPWAALDLLIVETCTVADRTFAAGYDEVVALAAGHGMVEVDRWVRDYGWIHRWARGQTGRRPPEGEVRDVVFARG